MKNKTLNQMRSLKNKIKNFFKIPDEVFEEEPSPEFERQKFFNLTKNKLFFGILAFLILVNILVFFDLNQFYIRAILSFIFLITIPGLLIMLMLKIRNTGFWEYLVYTIGLSISFIMFAGLAVNWILPWLNITDKPLSLYPILICFNIFLIALGIVAFKRNKDFKPFQITFPKLDTTNRIFFIIPMAFPVLSILGAFLLNNHGTNILTMIMLGSIAVYVLAIVIFRKRLNGNVFPWALWMIGLALLLMYSMRSWFVLASGDIGQEFYVFKLTLMNQKWDMNYFRDAYNACLSITVLPTIISLFLNIKNQLIFKASSIFLISFIPLVIYLLSRIFFTKSLSFLSSFFFISSGYFFSYFPNLIRQAISLSFFSLLLLGIFKGNLSPTQKKYLLIIFGFSMIVSHYSTSYISLIIFTLFYLIISFYNFWLKKTNNLIGYRNYVGGILILILLIFGFFWLSQLTNVSSGFIHTAKDSFNNIDKIFSDELRVEQISLLNQINIFYAKKNPNAHLNEYEEATTQSYENSHLNFYPIKDYENYPVFIKNEAVLPSKFNKQVTVISYLIFKILKISIYFLIFLGIICLFFNLKKFTLGYALISFLCFIFLSCMTLLPVVALRYSIERFYQHMLIILTPIFILGSITLFKPLKLKPLIPISILIIVFYLFITGFAIQLIGGINTPLQLNNFGAEYNSLYTHKYEVYSSFWIGLEKSPKDLIYSDKPSKRKLFAFALVNNYLSMNILPKFIGKDSYVYSNYINKVFSRETILYQGSYITLNFPTKFLNDNKNKLYSNGGSEIFK